MATPRDETKPMDRTADRTQVIRINHSIHAVFDLAACRVRYLDTLGGLLFAEGYFEPEDREMALMYVTDHMIEPMAPRNPGNMTMPYARYLSRYGQGWHSFELKIKDGAALAARLKADGCRLASEYGSFFYVRPESTGGVLVEFCDVPMPNDPYDRRNWRGDWAEGMPSTLLRLDHIACVVPDLARTIGFFTTYLDCDIIEERAIDLPQPGRRTLLRVGQDQVAFIEPDEPAQGPLGAFLAPPTSGVYALVWAVEDERAAEAVFNDQGLRTVRNGCVSPGFAIDPADFFDARHEFCVLR